MVFGNFFFLKIFKFKKGLFRKNPEGPPGGPPVPPTPGGRVPLLGGRAPVEPKIPLWVFWAPGGQTF